MSKADTMLSILWLLKSGRRMTAKQLAEELEIHIRTVYRCIDGLCVSGVPIISDTGRNGGYSLLGRFQDTPLFFDLDEQKALVHAAVFAQEAGYPFGDALSRAVAKLKQYTNPEQRTAIERHEASLEVIHPPADPSLASMLQQLELAISDGATLMIDYRSGYEGSAQTRGIDPYGLVHWKSKWYIVAYCHLRQEIRSFRADRVLALSRAGSVFEQPAAFSARHFFMSNLLPAPENEDSLISVRIQGNPQAINDLCEHWLFGHALVERTEDHAHFKLNELAFHTYVPYFLLVYGGSIRVLEPSELKESLVYITESLLNYYRTF